MCYAFNIEIMTREQGNLTMTMIKRAIARAVSAIAVLAFGLAGCLSISPPNIDLSTSTSALTGAPYCEHSGDGKMVACGAIAQGCQKSPDGRMVACGGMATVCATSPDGKMVACGDRAAHCARSPDGKMVACGGAAPMCDKSADGKMVACGGSGPKSAPAAYITS